MTLRLISGSRFDGPGSRRVVGRTHPPAVQSPSDERALAFLRSYDSLSVSLDGMTDENGAGVYNIIVCTPRPFLVGTFRLGPDPGTVDILIGHLAAGLQGPLLVGVATSSAVELERGECTLSLISSRCLLALSTDSPSTRVALRTRAINRGMFLFAFGCAAHAANPVASDASRVPVCAAMPPSAAGSERRFKALKSVPTTRRNRLANCRVDSQTRVVFNSAQLRSGVVMGAYKRPIAQHELVAMLAGKTGTAAPQQAPPPDADDGGDHEETSGGSGGLIQTQSRQMTCTKLMMTLRWGELLTLVWWRRSWSFS